MGKRVKGYVGQNTQVCMISRHRGGNPSIKI